MVVKHGGKKYDLELDTTANGETFKYQIFSVTNVEPERQKVLVKGGQLKDEQDMSKLGIKPGQQIMVMGTASGAGTISKPKDAPKFLEDMTEAEKAQSDFATPAGLQNLGNTCYMNSSLQALRAIPELQEELKGYKPASGASSSTGVDLSQFGLSGLGSSNDLTQSLSDLYNQMGQTQEGFPPMMFLNAFRNKYPQFAEKSRDGRGYAQQDAEEAWSQLIFTLQRDLKLSADKPSESSSTPSASNTTATETTAPPAQKGFIDTYLGGVFTRVEKCNDPAAAEAEPPTNKPDETFYKLNCHVASQEVKHLGEGIRLALEDTYSKTSPTLGREVEYTTTSRIARLPQYLPVHFVRFFWKRDVNKKAKILRKVTFPVELDCVEYCTPELAAQLRPVRDAVRELRKEIQDVERARKRQKLADKAAAAELARNGPSDEASAAPLSHDKAKATDADGDVDVEYKTDAQIEAERAASILTAKRHIFASISPEIATDRGANQTGLYELRAVVTHQGASADSGHYTAYVKKEGRRDAATGKRGEEDGKWWWFNDDKVSEVEGDRIETLSGGGESHSALILVYRAVEVPQLTDEEKELEKSQK